MYNKEENAKIMQELLRPLVTTRKRERKIIKA